MADSLAASLAPALSRAPLPRAGIRFCEVNPIVGSGKTVGGLGRALRANGINVSRHTVIVCGGATDFHTHDQSRGRTHDAPSVRVLNAAPRVKGKATACTVRGHGLEDSLGTCDAWLIGIHARAFQRRRHAASGAGTAEGSERVATVRPNSAALVTNRTENRSAHAAEARGDGDGADVDDPGGAAAMRTALLMEVTYLLQLASARDAFVALHGSPCLAPSLRAKYTAPFFMRNMTEPCWRTRFDGWVRSGSLVRASCVPSDVMAGAPRHQPPLPSSPSASSPSSAVGSTSEAAGRTAGDSPSPRAWLCMGDFHARRSACWAQHDRPLLERWHRRSTLAHSFAGGGGGGNGGGSDGGGSSGPGQATADLTGAWPAGGAEGAPCTVRKQHISVRAHSRMWAKATAFRSTLSHLYRRHLRYYSAFECEHGEQVGCAREHCQNTRTLSTLFPPRLHVMHRRASHSQYTLSAPAPPSHCSPRWPVQVCLLFKDDVNEAWVAGLNSTDGIDFGGDPILVMPRLPLRTALAQPASTPVASLPGAQQVALHSPGADSAALQTEQGTQDGAGGPLAHRRMQETPSQLASATGREDGSTESPVPDPSRQHASSLTSSAAPPDDDSRGHVMRRRPHRHAAASSAQLPASWAAHGGWPYNSSAAIRGTDSLSRVGKRSATVPASSTMHHQHARRRSSRPARGRLARIQEAAASMSHNLALAVSGDGSVWYAAGGRHNRVNDVLAQLSPLLKAEDVRRGLGFDPMYFGAPRIGVHLARGATWRYTAAPAAPAHARAAPTASAESGARSSERRRQGGGQGGARHTVDRSAHSSQTRSWLHSSGAVDEPPTTQWQHKRHILSGRHPGCVERRDATSRFFNYLHPGGVCEFDGRLSLVRYGPTLLLYARANPAAHGSRHVQVTRSADDGATWSPFEQIELQNYAGDGDIYFFGAQVNPSHNGSLLAVFPITHRLRGCIGLAASLDGVHWSRVTPLLSCDLYGERTLDQPALPAMVRRGEEVWLYVQEEVPGITIDRSTPLLLHTSLVKAERNSRVARYAFPCRHLARWTLGALKTLQPDLRFDHSCAATDKSARSRDVSSASPARAAPASCTWKPRGPATTD